ncbi:MAG: hypothetical protein ACXWJL_10995 [Xanthobacteraceae bacterium]
MLARMFTAFSSALLPGVCGQRWGEFVFAAVIAVTFPLVAPKLTMR